MLFLCLDCLILHPYYLYFICIFLLCMNTIPWKNMNICLVGKKGSSVPVPIFLNLCKWKKYYLENTCNVSKFSKYRFGKSVVYSNFFITKCYSRVSCWRRLCCGVGGVMLRLEWHSPHCHPHSLSSASRPLCSLHAQWE